MIKKCKLCKKKFKTYESRVKSSRGKYCSKKCAYKDREGMTSWNAGKKCPSLSISKIGDRNPMWKGGYDKKKSDREYAKKNRQQIYKKQREWNLKNKHKIKEWKHRWAKENPEKRAIQWQRRRENELANGGSMTHDEWTDIKKRQRGRCNKCGKKKKLTIDHKIPVSKWKKWAKINKPEYKCGDKNNIQGLCRFCNTSKGAKVVHF